MICLKSMSLYELQEAHLAGSIAFWITATILLIVIASNFSKLARELRLANQWNDTFYKQNIQKTESLQKLNDKFKN